MIAFIFVLYLTWEAIMELKTISLILSLLLLTSISRGQTYVSGNIGSSTWSIDGSPYIVTGDIYTETLTIDAGVTVQFDAVCTITIANNLFIYGTETDSVLFTAGLSNWEQIYFHPLAEYHDINYAIFEGAIGGNVCGMMQIFNSPTFFRHCTFRNNDCHDMMLWSNSYLSEDGVRFEDCDFRDNIAETSLFYMSSGVTDSSPSSALFRNCRFFNNDARELIQNQHSHTLIYQCTFFDNDCDWAMWLKNGLVTFSVFYNAVPDGNPVFHNMDFFDPGEVQNSIIWGNNLVVDHPEAMEINYCDVEVMTPGTGNISSDPQFIDPLNLNFNVQPGSPCIDAGNPGGFWFDSDGSRADIGLSGNSGFIPMASTLEFYQLNGYSQTKHFFLFNLYQFEVDIVSASITPSTGFSYINPFPVTLTPYDMVQIPVTFTSTGDSLNSSMVLFSESFVENDTASFRLIGNGSGYREITGEVEPDTVESYTVYDILDNLVVPDGEQLMLLPSTNFCFYEGTSLKIEGNLHAMGALSDSVYLYKINDAWGGLIFDNADGENILNYTKIVGAEGNAVTYGNGGGIVASNTDLTITNSFICCYQSSNSEMPIRFGGGLYALLCPQITIENSTFYNCDADSAGGAIWISNSPVVAINHVNFLDCRTKGNGGGIHFENATATIDSSFFNDTGTELQGLTGMAIYAKNSNIDIMRTIVSQCRRGSNYSSAIALNNSSQVSFDHSDICFTQWTTNVGAWDLIDARSSLMISNSIFYEMGDFLSPASYNNFSMTYSISPVQQQGEGNISGDPLITEECLLTSSSPCIDAGDPAAHLDPDSTRSDMGVNYYEGGGAISGPVSGIWTAANSPYIIGNDAYVPAGQTLDIMPGVTVEILDQSSFTVNGVLLISGTAYSIVSIAGEENNTDFIIQSESNTSFLNYAELDNLAFRLASSGTVMEHCNIYCDIDAENSWSNILINSSVYGGIDSGDDWTIVNCNLQHWTSGSFFGIESFCVEYATGTFTGNTMSASAHNYWEEGSAVSAGFYHCGGLFNHNVINASASAEMGTSAYGLEDCSGTCDHNCINADDLGVSDFTGDVFNNTFIDCDAGAIETDLDPTVVRNNIIKDCNVGFDGPIEARYTCIFNSTTPFTGGATAGPGVIYDDPMLINNWYLDPNSPCIDAGDPDPYYNDPDGTRNDMGANYFDQGAGNVTVTLTPVGLPIQIPASGGSFDFNIAVTNNGFTQIVGQLWCNVLFPDSTVFGPVLGPVNLNMPSSWAGDRDRTQVVPDFVPSGIYTYQAFIGIDEETIWDSDSFVVEKLETGEGPLYQEWRNYGDPFDDWILSKFEADIPTTWSLDQNYPNPFNPVTTICFAVPKKQLINLSVYNMLGQQVAEPVDGFRDAGYHEVTFDGSYLASGIYFYELRAGDFSSVKKMVLIK